MNGDEELAEEEVIDDTLETDAPADEIDAVEGAGEGDPEEGESPELEVEISLGEETPPQVEDKTAPKWVKELRKSQRELQKENRKLREQLGARATENKPVELGVKPKLEDFQFNEDRFEAALLEWNGKKAAIQKQEDERKRLEKEQADAWQNTLDAYGRSKTSLKLKDFDEAEDVVQNTLSVTQQSIILSAARTPAELIYALGRNPVEAKRLAGIKDPVKFAAEIGRLEATKLKVVKKGPPAPETVPRSSGGTVGTTNAILERLRAEADKTGDRTKVVAYMRKLRTEQRK